MKYLEDFLVEQMSKVEVGPDFERSRLMLYLYMGMDGVGSRTLGDVQSILDGRGNGSAAYSGPFSAGMCSAVTERKRGGKSGVISTEGIRKIIKKTTAALKESMGWPEYMEDLANFVVSQAPIEHQFLARRLYDPTLPGLDAELPRQPGPGAFCRRPFAVTGLLSILSLRPNNLPALPIVSKMMYPTQLSREGRKEVREQSGQSRNVHYSRHFILPDKFPVSLENLISHAIRVINFNGLVREQNIVPLMPRSLPLIKREELAHSIVTCRPDFAWVDEGRGWFTFTELFDNRVTGFVKKVFAFTEQVKINALIASVTRAVRAPARALKGAGASEHSKARARLLADSRFGATEFLGPELFRRYLEIIGVCQVAEDGTVTPLPRLFEVDGVPRWHEEIMVNVLRGARDEVMSHAELKAAATPLMANAKKLEYLDRLREWLSDGRLSVMGEDFIMPASEVSNYLGREQIEIRRLIDKLGAKKMDFDGQIADILMEIDDRRDSLTAEMAEAKSWLTQMTASASQAVMRIEGGDNGEQSDLRQDAEEKLMAVRATKDAVDDLTIKIAHAVDPADRAKSLENAIRKFKREMAVARRTNNMSRAESVLKNISTLEAMVANVDNEPDTIEIAKLRRASASVKSEIDSMPAANDKFDTLIWEAVNSCGTRVDGAIVGNIDQLRRVVIETAESSEMEHALAHFNYNIAYSPALIWLERKSYTRVGSPISEAMAMIPLSASNPDDEDAETSPAR